MAPNSCETQICQSNKIYIENLKNQNTGTRGGCSGTTNPRGTQKFDNPLKGVRDTFPQDLDNPLLGIRDIVKNGTWSQWPRGLTIPT